MALAQFCWCSRRYLCLDLGVLSTNHPPAMLFEHQTGILAECTVLFCGCPILCNAILWATTVNVILTDEREREGRCLFDYFLWLRCNIGKPSICQEWFQRIATVKGGAKRFFPRKLSKTMRVLEWLSMVKLSKSTMVIATPSIVGQFFST